jgi:hypothetical protein
MKCTSCSAVRDKDVVFFLEDEAPEVTDDGLKKTASGGADWICGYCKTTNRADVPACKQCNAPREGMKSRETRETRFDTPTTPPPGGKDEAQKPVTVKKLLPAIIAAGFISLFLITLGTCLGKTGRTEMPLTVTGGEWTRTITCETLTTEIRKGWENEVPGGAEIIRTWEAQRDTEKVQTGTEQVKVGTKDMGNGFFEDVYEDRPVYEERPVMDTMAEYELEVWKTSREVSLSGQLGETPVWPTITLKEGEREGPRQESAVLNLEGDLKPKKPGLESTDYRGLDPEGLNRYKPGDRVTATVKKRNGAVVKIKD